MCSTLIRSWCDALERVHGLPFCIQIAYRDSYANINEKNRTIKSSLCNSRKTLRLIHLVLTVKPEVIEDETKAGFHADEEVFQIECKEQQFHFHGMKFHEDGKSNAYIKLGR